MTDSNRIAKVAIVGAGGNVGRFITEALLKTGKQGASVERVDYDKPETLVEALKGQDALIITLSGHSLIQETEDNLIKAAAEANVSWILPNEWSPDTANEGLINDVFVFQPKVATRKTIEALGKSSYISVATGFWYEYTLALAPAYGFDFANRTVTFFDEGETKISTSSWPQVGRAVAALLSLPVKPEGPNQEAYLEKFKNQVVYVNSFTVSQKDMLASVVRVTGTKEADWTIKQESSRERYTTGVAEVNEGNRNGFFKMMFTRVFYADGCGDFEKNKGTLNALLGLPQEDIDAATRTAIERSEASAAH